MALIQESPSSPTSSSPSLSSSGRMLGKIRRRFQLAIDHLLNPDNFPHLFCHLCYRCVQIVRSVDGLTDENTDVARWAVGCLVFLRLLVPLITKYFVFFSLSFSLHCSHFLPPLLQLKNIQTRNHLYGKIFDEIMLWK